MKKFTLFSAFAVFLSACAIGCSSDGINSFCRTGSLFPTVRSSQNYKGNDVYLQAVKRNNCLPCEEVQPCSPCEPVCNPCDNACTGSVVPGGLISHPTGG